MSVAAPAPAARRAAALVAVAVAVVIWSASNVAIKETRVSGLVASFWRLWIAIPLLWLVVLSVPRLRARLDGAFVRASLQGGLLFGGHQLLFFTALKWTSVATVSVFGALQPALVLAVAGPLFGERVTARTVGWSLVALAGAAVVVAGGAGAPGRTLAGDVVAAANLVAFTAYFLASKQLRVRLGTLEYVCGLTTVAGMVVAVACLLAREPLGTPTRSDWALLTFVALVPGTLGHLLVNWAHSHAPAVITSVMLLGVPVLATAGAAVVLAEPVTAVQVVGGVAVLLAVGRLVVAPAHEELAEAAAETEAP